VIKGGGADRGHDEGKGREAREGGELGEYCCG
jgi:hypothetical protein